MLNDEAKRCVEALRKPVWGESARVVADRARAAADLIESISAELEQVKRERDAMRRDLKEIGLCFYCKHFEDVCRGKCMFKPGQLGRTTDWEWRGVQEDGRK